MQSMLLEKLKKHGRKMMFFAMNILIVTSGVFFIKQKTFEEKPDTSLDNTPNIVTNTPMPVATPKTTSAIAASSKSSTSNSSSSSSSSSYSTPKKTTKTS